MSLSRRCMNGASGRRETRVSVSGSRAMSSEELRRLRKENRRLQMEKDILKKAAAFFARATDGRRARCSRSSPRRRRASRRCACRALEVNRTSFRDWERRPP